MDQFIDDVNSAREEWARSQQTIARGAQQARCPLHDVALAGFFGTCPVENCDWNLKNARAQAQCAQDPGPPLYQSAYSGDLPLCKHGKPSNALSGCDECRDESSRAMCEQLGVVYAAPVNEHRPQPSGTLMAASIHWQQQFQATQGIRGALVNLWRQLWR